MTTQCYGTDGTPEIAGRYIPCNITAVENGGHTSCCAENDRCMTNGLCQEAGGNKRGVNLFWRNGCTDPTWKDAACPRYCVGNNKPDSQAVHYCLSGSAWCCLPKQGAKDIGVTTNTTCCTIDDLKFTAPSPLVFTIAQNQVLNTATESFSSLRISTISTAKATSTSVASSATSAQGAASASALPAGTSSSSFNSKIGIYVGVPLGIVLLIALAAIGWLFMRKRRNARSNNVTHGKPSYEAEMKYPQYAEADVGTRPSELPGGREVFVELPDNKE